VRKPLLTAVVLTGLFTLTTPNASAASAISLHAEFAQAQGNVTKVDYRSNGHHWHHQSMHHGHWHYWN
jgi:hypothetical protein